MEQLNANERPKTVIAIIREVVGRVKVVLFNSSGTEIGTASNPIYTLSLSNNGVPNVTSGTTAPTSTPAKIGDIYVDTTTPTMYFAKGTSSVSDWIAI
jgi:hypothetical protein